MADQRPLASILIPTVILTLIILISGFTILSRPQEESPVNVLYAGSLIPVMETKLGPTFKEQGFNYKGEGHGSVQNANMVIDGQRTPDVFISAGWTPTRMLMEHEPPLATWFITFTSDEIVIAYNPRGKFRGLFEEARLGIIPWYKVLAHPEVRFLRTDPELDPKGYYMVIVAKLADVFYGEKHISEGILRGERNLSQIAPEEILITLLESGEADAVAAYRHEAVERGLSFISLPVEINLGDKGHADAYRLVNYTFKSGRAVYGEPIVFTATIPTTARNVDGAVAFVGLLLSEKGQTLLAENGFGKGEFTVEGGVKDIPVEIRLMLNLDSR